jgi:hypothetical protein
LVLPPDNFVEAETDDDEVVENDGTAPYLPGSDHHEDSGAEIARALTELSLKE